MAKLSASQMSAKTAKKSQKVKKVSAVEAEAQVASAAVAHDDAQVSSAVPGAHSAIVAGDSGGSAAAGSGGGSAALPILGGLAVAGGVAAFALGGGETNVAPTVAATQTVAGTEDTPSTITVAATDANKNDVLTYTVSTPGNGTATMNGNVVTYTPKANYNGADTFTVTVKDSKGLTATQTVTVNVAAVNDAPTFAASSQAVTTAEDTAKTFTVQATDVENDALTYTAGAASKGTVVVSGNNITYTPSKDFNGTDSFVVTAKDPSGATATQTINVTVTPVNDAPVFAAATLAVVTDEDAAKTFTVLATDVENDPLTYTAGAASKGTVVVSGNNITYTPSKDFNGTDSFVVTAKDPSGATATQTINVTVNPVNDAPVFAAAALAVSTDEDTAKTFTVLATDVENDPLTYTAGAAKNGTVTVSGGSITYTPSKDFNGADSFVVTAKDPSGATATQTINVTVNPVNDAPVITAAATRTITTAEDTAAKFVIDATDVENDPLKAVVVTGPANGTLSTDAQGNNIYTPKLNYNGTDSFVIGISDGKARTDYTVTVNVTPVNDAPVFAAASQAVSTDEDTAKTFTVLATDVENDPLTYTAGAASNGTVTVSGGSVTYTPSANFNGTDSFVVTAKDPSGATATQTINVTVKAVDDSIDVANDTTATTYVAVKGVVDVYTDDSALKTNAIITGLTSEDSIVVSAAASNYSFSSVGSDIQISYNNTTAGVVNTIVLKGLAGTAFVSDEASAERAAGWDFFKSLIQPSGSGTSGTAGAGGNLDADSDGNPLTQATVSALGANSFTEDANVANFVKITDFSSDDTITVSNALTSAYSFTSKGTDIQITYTTSAGVVNDITLVNVISAGTFIGSEADAERALGRDFFKNATVTETATSKSLDVGTASTQAIVSGAGAAVTFTDDATKNSFVRITDFTAGDSIRVTGASETQYSFSSSDLDGDGSADDLSISYSNAGSGVVNDIQILNVVSPSAFVFDKASAIAAVGFNFITFG